MLDAAQYSHKLDSNRTTRASISRTRTVLKNPLYSATPAKLATLPASRTRPKNSGWKCSSFV